MFFTGIAIGRYQTVLAILLTLAIEKSLATSKSIAATLVAPPPKHDGTWVIPNQRQRYQNEERYCEIQVNRKGIEDVTPSLHHISFLKIHRGGGDTVKSGSVTSEEHLLTTTSMKVEKGAFDNKHKSMCGDVVRSKSTIITIGVVDISGIRSNSADLRSSITLLVDCEVKNDDIRIDKKLLQKIVLPLFQDKASDTTIEISSKEMEENVNTILESLSLLCDVLVVRIDDEEKMTPESMSYVMRGNRERKPAGMAGGRLWLSTTKGPGQELRRLFCNSEDDEEDGNCCQSSTTTWTALFSSSKAEKKIDDELHWFLAPSLKELFTSFSQQVIRSKRRSTQKAEQRSSRKSSSKNTVVDFFPMVSVLCINKKSGQSTLQDDQIKLAPCSAKKEVINIEERTQTLSKFNTTSDENRTGPTNQQQDNDEIVEDMIGMAYRRLEDIEEKMQDLVLDQSSNPMPLLEFGNLVHDILQTMESKVKGEKGMHDSFRHGLMKGIVVEVQRLHKDQLQALRNYYGQRYESILDEELEHDIHNDETIERKWAIGAEHMTQAFLAAAINAVPAMYRNDLNDNNDTIKIKNQASFDHVDALQGLIQDMIESTERRKEEYSIATMLVANEEKGNNSDGASTSPRICRLPKMPKWLERLAARAFVFGVNYVQGWLAWQGIKNAALERDRNQPKFPLF